MEILKNGLPTAWLPQNAMKSFLGHPPRSVNLAMALLPFRAYIHIVADRGGCPVLNNKKSGAVTNRLRFFYTYFLISLTFQQSCRPFRAFRAAYRRQTLYPPFCNPNLKPRQRHSLYIPPHRANQSYHAASSHMIKSLQ